MLIYLFTPSAKFGKHWKIALGSSDLKVKFLLANRAVFVFAMFKPAVTTSRYQSYAQYIPSLSLSLASPDIL